MRNIHRGSAAPSGERYGEVFDPNAGTVQAHVAFGTAADLDRAVAAAQAAQPGWAATNPQRRARVMFRFKELVERDARSASEYRRRRSTPVMISIRSKALSFGSAKGHP